MKVTGLSRVSKDIIIGEIEKELKSRQTFFIAQHGAISATALDQLRAKLRTSNARYFVVKNSLGKKAFEKANMKDLGEQLDGACGIAFTDGDAIASSKALVDFAKTNEVFKIQSAWFNGQMMSAAQVKMLAGLPSREVLLSRVVGGMQSPIRGFVNVLAGSIRQIVTVIDAIAKKKGEKG